MTYGVGYSICKNQCKNSKPRIIIQDKQPKYWMGFQLRLIQNYHYANGTNLRRCKNYSHPIHYIYSRKQKQIYIQCCPTTIICSEISPLPKKINPKWIFWWIWQYVHMLLTLQTISNPLTDEKSIPAWIFNQLLTCIWK